MLALIPRQLDLPIPMDRLVSLDLVRFFAAFSVVTYHYTARGESSDFPLLSQVSQFGYLGVPLFFIISGYVISLSANNRSPIEFAVSRFIRLYPAFWAGIFVTCTILFFYNNDTLDVAQILANLTMLNDYLGHANIDGVYWTLQAELKFYACVFLLLAFNVFHKFHYWLTFWVVLTFAHTLIGQPYFMGWFISPSYSCYFIAGVALYLIHKGGRNIFNISILLSSLVLSAYNSYHQAAEFIPNPSQTGQLIAASLCCLFFMLFYALVRGHLQLKSSSYLLTLGAITYPLYLIHNVAGKTLIDLWSPEIGETAAVFFVILIALAVSYLIHITVEKRLASPMKAVLLSLLQQKLPSTQVSK